MRWLRSAAVLLAFSFPLTAFAAKIDAVQEFRSTAAAVSMTDTLPTITTAENRSAVVVLMCANPSNNTVPSNFAVKWDSTGTNTSMTQVGTVQSNTAGSTAVSGVVFKIANMTGGSGVNIAATWTTQATCFLTTTSWTSADQRTIASNVTAATAISGTSISVTQSPAGTTGTGTVSSYVEASMANSLTGTSDTGGGTEITRDNGGCCASGSRYSGSGGMQFTYIESGTIANALAISVIVCDLTNGCTAEAPRKQSGQRSSLGHDPSSQEVHYATAHNDVRYVDDYDGL